MKASLLLALAALPAFPEMGLAAHGGEYPQPVEPVPPALARGPISGRPRTPAPPPPSLLRTLGDPGETIQARLEALRAVSLQSGPLPFALLERIRNHCRGADLATYAHCLGRCGPEALEALRELAGHREPEVQAEAVFGLVRLDEDEGEGFARALLADPERPSAARVAALRALSRRDSPFARVEAIRALPSAEGALLMEALSTLRSQPAAENARFLIQAVAQRDGRARREVVRCLQRLTGYRIGEDARSWEAFRLGHESQGTPFRLTDGEAQESNTGVSYLGVPILGERVVFLLDYSGSMTGQLITDRTGPAPGTEVKESRGTRALRELEATLRALPAGRSFKIVAFAESAVRFSDDGFVAATQESAQAAMDWLRNRPFTGYTDLLAALEAAFACADPDEIILLSDGVPNAGSTPDPAQILRQVERLNRWRNVRIHAIALGAPLAARYYLQELADAHDGALKVIN